MRALPSPSSRDTILTRALFSLDSANNIPNTYSAALLMQTLGRPFAKVPCFVWTILALVIYTVAGVAGREHFSEILSNFLSILSYWTAFFIVNVPICCVRRMCSIVLANPCAAFA